MKLSDDKIKKLSSNSICELIVVYRNFNFDNSTVDNLMKELSRRRLAGDNFDFESKLNSIVKEIEEIKSKVIFSEDQIE